MVDKYDECDVCRCVRVPEDDDGSRWIWVRSRDTDVRVCRTCVYETVKAKLEERQDVADRARERSRR